VTDFVKTISAGLNLFGQGPAELWASTSTSAHAMLFGDDWGEGSEDIPQAVVHYNDPSSIPATSTVTPSAYFVHTAVAGTILGLSSATPHMVFNKTVDAGSISPLSDPTSEGRGDGAGYVRLFPGGVSNAESGIWDKSTVVSDQTSTYTAVADPSTVWTEV
jgi:hypothetical protein